LFYINFYPEQNAFLAYYCVKVEGLKATNFTLSSFSTHYLEGNMEEGFKIHAEADIWNPYHLSPLHSHFKLNFHKCFIEFLVGFFSLPTNTTII